jgi:hypothetical protein
LGDVHDYRLIRRSHLVLASDYEALAHFRLGGWDVSAFADAIAYEHYPLILDRKHLEMWTDGQYEQWLGRDVGKAVREHYHLLDEPGIPRLLKDNLLVPNGKSGAMTQSSGPVIPQ